MIRRLHLEEVQPPVATVAAASELNKSGDDEERKALALEFKELLSKVVGQVDPLSDESTALGLALAQTMPAQRAAHQELRKTEDADRTQENGDQDLLDEEGSDREELAVAADDTQEGNDSRQGAKSVESNADGADERGQCGAETNSNDLASQITVETDLSAINQVTADSAAGTSSQPAGLLDTGSAKESVAVDPQAFTIAATSDNITAASGEVTAQVQAGLAQENVVRVKVDDALSDDSDAELGIEDLTGQVNAAQSGENEVVRRVISANKPAENADFNQSVGGSAATVAEDKVSAEMPQSRAELRPGTEGDSPSVSAVRKGVENNFKDDPASKKLATDEPEVISPAVSQNAKRGAEGVVQMAILRQAFESLRAARQDSSEGQQKPSSPAVTGATASSAPKRSEDASSSKGSRATNKSHIARMLERVQSTLTEAAKARDGKTISLRLDPANLGRVKVDVSLKDGSLHARITPENQQVMTALQEHAHELQGALRKLGLDVDSVTVTVRSEGAQEEAQGGQNSFDGSAFQQERNNMPHERSQVVENTIGNELAQWKGAVAPEQGVEVVDHWVA